MDDLSSLDERHVRHYYSEIVQVYRRGMLDASHGFESQAHYARLLEECLTRYQAFLWRDQQAEIDQLSRQIGLARASLRRGEEDSDA
jgi:hypothetical protein